MENTEIDRLIDLSGEPFYEHIQQQYGNFVTKILRYHDIDRYTILNRTDKRELINFFEKPNDEYSTPELINLKKDICNTSQECVSIKIGTKNKIISLLKSTHFIVKKKKQQMLSIIRSNRLDAYQLSSSPNNNTSDSDINEGNYKLLVETSIDKLLKNLKNNIHGNSYTNISAKDFNVVVENTSDSIPPICYIQCLCRERIKLYLRADRFQLSNLTKHMKIVKDKSVLLINNHHQPSNNSDALNRTDIDDQVLGDASDEPTSQNTPAQQVHVDIDDSDSSPSVAIERSQTKKVRIESSNNNNDNDDDDDDGDGENRNLLAKIKKRRHNGQVATGNSPKVGDTESSISIIPSSYKKKQYTHNQQRQQQPQPQPITTSQSNYQHLKSSKEQNLHGNNSSQSNKRKYDQHDRSMKSSSSTKNKKTSEQNISSSNTDRSDILCTLLNTIDLNRHRPPNNYRYPNSVLRFAACLFILAGVYVYKYVCLNLKFLLPSIQTIKKYYTDNPYSEAKFRYDESKIYLDSIQCQYVFLSEDCSAIIPRIEYDSTLNTFNGFVTPMSDGIPTQNAFNCQSFEELKYLIDNQPRAKLVNIHSIQPIYNKNLGLSPPATVLAVYGTNNKINSIDILKRWINIFQEFFSRNIRVIGFSTDGDPKYLRCMRLALNFFVKTQTLNINNDRLSFKVNIPANWSSWYFLKSTQLILVMQDGIHLCTKMRNRLLSNNARLRMGNYKISICHLFKIIQTTNKIDHNLSRSDLNVKDRQNFASCQRISSDKVLNILSSNDEFKGTYNYLLLINLLILAYTNRHLSLSTRIYYGWIILFFIRLWRIWLYITRRKRKSRTNNKNLDDHYYFITSNALLAIEINAHCLIYVYLLIEQKSLPESIANSIHLFSSQPCECVFRDARALSGIYSTRINFTMKQFLKRVNKLNALAELKQFELTNGIEKIHFPIHHKIKKFTDYTDPHSIYEDTDFNSNNVNTIVSQAYEVAQEMAISVRMNNDLIKHNLFNMEESSKLSEKLLTLNSLSESEILVIDGHVSEDSDEEQDFEEHFDGENHWLEDLDEEEENGMNDDEEHFGINDDDGVDGDQEDNVDDEEIDEVDEIDDEEVDEVDYEEIDEESVDDDDGEEEEDDVQPTSTFENLQSTSYSGLRLTKFVSNKNLNKYFKIYVKNKKLFLHKQTATWYLQDKQTRISTDRTKRVQLQE